MVDTAYTPLCMYQQSWKGRERNHLSSIQEDLCAAMSCQRWLIYVYERAGGMHL